MTQPCNACAPVYVEAELEDPSAPWAPSSPPAPTMGTIVDDVLKVLGYRLPTSPLPLADALFGAPGWLVPVVLAGLAGAGVVGLYATGNLTKKKRGGKRRLARRAKR